MEDLPQDAQILILSSLTDIFQLGRISLVCKSWNQMVQHSPVWDTPLNPIPSGSIFRLPKVLSVSGGFARMKPKLLRDVRKWHVAFHRSHWVPFSYRDLPLCRPFLEILDLYGHGKLSPAERYILPAVLVGMNVISKNTENGSFFAFLVGTIQGLISGDGVAVIINTTLESSPSKLKEIEKLAKPLCLSCYDCSVSVFPTEKTDRIIFGTAEQLQSCIQNHRINITQIRFCIILDSHNDLKSLPLQSFLCLLSPFTQLMVQSNFRNILSATSEKKLFHSISGVLKIESKTESIRDYEKLDLEENLLRGVHAECQYPTVIHQKAILPAMLGEDIVVQDSDNLERSFCYIISILHQVDPSKTTLQALIIVPTQKAIHSAHTLFDNVGKYLKVKTTAISVIPNNFSIPEGIHVVITKFSLCFQLVQTLKMQELKILVIDELKTPLEESEVEIFRRFPSTSQVQIYTTQLVGETHDAFEKYTHRPLKKIVKREHHYTLEGMKQFYVNCERQAWKFGVLCDLMDTIDFSQLIVYCSTRRKVEWVHQKLTEQQFTCGMVHRSMNRQQLDEVYSQFHRGLIRILISAQMEETNLSNSFNLILFYDPPHCEEYINMVGRSGKFGRKGVTIIFIAEGEAEKLRVIEQMYQVSIDELPANVDDII